MVDGSPQLLWNPVSRSKVRHFMRDIESLSIRFPDVTERQLEQIFWRGIHQELRLHLISRSLDPERNTLKNLAKYATREENVREAFKRKQKVSQSQNFNNGKFANGGQGQKTQTANNRSAPQRQTGNNTGNDRGKKSNKGNTDRKQRECTDNISKEERDRLRAEGRCFNCKAIGHESRNCPDRQTAKGPTLNAGSVNFAGIETHAKAARETNLRVGAVGISVEEPAREGQRFQDHTEDAQAYLVKLFESYYGYEAGDDERFTVIDYGDSFELTDWQRPNKPYMIGHVDLKIWDTVFMKSSPLQTKFLSNDIPAHSQMKARLTNSIRPSTGYGYALRSRWIVAHGHGLRPRSA
jgi:hypothetical protein